MREEFEKWAKMPPYEFDTARWSESASVAWPGNYKAYHVNCAWEGYQAGSESRQPEIDALKSRILAQDGALENSYACNAVITKISEDALIEVDALRAELEAVRKDAERYQFIRGGGAYIEPHPDSIYVATDRGNYMKTNSEFDAAIDAAMGE